MSVMKLDIELSTTDLLRAAQLPPGFQQLSIQ